jgi:hypothetical protein
VDVLRPQSAAAPVVDPQEEERVKRAQFANNVLQVFGEIGHGRLWCTCGYLIWTCGLHKECEGPRGMIETDHALCKKKTK